MSAGRTVDQGRVFGPICISDIVRYAGASGDFNPIHHDPDFAKSAGLQTVLVMGMLPGGMLGAYVADCFGAENIVRLSLRFRGQVWPGDVVTLTASFVGENSDGVEDYDLEVRAADRGVVISGAVTTRRAPTP
jgi:acyl dehydratase